MIKLSETQRALLSGASQREDRSVLPLTGTLESSRGRVDKSVTGLLTRGLIEERETDDIDAVHRTNGNVRFGLYLTETGADAAGLADNRTKAAAHAEEREDAAQSASAAVPAKAQTKGAIVLALLQRSDGATMPDLIAATGWLPHTTRAALTALRKKGHAVAKTKRDDATCYRIISEP